jgi:uncharacterized protein YlxP (DUF503 family)
MSDGVCGFLAIELRLAENHSLKGKRMVVRSLKDRLRNRFNVAVAELPPLDDHRTAVIGVATVSGDRAMVERTLARALDFVDGAGLAEVTDSRVELW